MYALDRYDEISIKFLLRLLDFGFYSLTLVGVMAYKALVYLLNKSPFCVIASLVYTMDSSFTNLVVLAYMIRNCECK